jgi:hypothetical protein
LYDAHYLQVAAYTRLDEAELARGLLESEGIQVALLDAQVSALGLGAAIGGVRMLVPAWEARRAHDLLSDPPRAAPGDGEVATPTPFPGVRLAAVPAAPPPIATRIALMVALALLGAVAAAVLR